MQMDVIIYYCDRIGEISDILFEKIFRLMPEERQVRVGRIQNHIRQLQSVGVYALFLYGCREEEKNCWRRWAENGDIPTFSYSKYGKPYLKKGACQFSFTHSGNMAACGFSSQPIGIDAEQMTSCTEQMAHLVFSQEEMIRWKLFPDEYWRNRYFVELWTRKESILKKKGLGFYGDLKNCQAEQAALKTWWLESYCLSVCSSGDDPGIQKVLPAELEKMIEAYDSKNTAGICLESGLSRE